MQILKRTYNSIREKGLSRTYQSVISVIEDFYFELKYGISTSKIVRREDLDISEKSKQHSEEYKPTRIRHFRLLIKSLDLPKDSVFVDMGSGKGRVLLMASLNNFKRVTGVELSSQLCEIARENKAKFEKALGKQLPINIVNIDVLEYNVQNDENVFYFYNPFDNYIMERIIERIKQSLIDNPRKIWLIINNFTPFIALIENRYKLLKSKEFIYGGTEFAVYIID
ncbi:MAG TPA: class I SAM-dependent methyltransferase [Ignavibacteriaceae bacterium]|mgnify:FL=1|nr:class I SAM-dependent methyltransferase [Ignavibacteriaceae bacterium]